MVNSVEGEWKNFVFKMITQEDYPKVLQNLKEVFCRDEPLLSLVNAADNPDMLTDMTTFATYILDKNDGTSFYVMHKDTGIIAGLRITYKVRKDDPTGPPFPLHSQKLGELFNNIVGLSKQANVFEHYGVDEMAEFLFTSINPAYRGQGLVSELYRRSFLLLKSKNFAMVKSTFTNPITYGLAVKYGFEERTRLRFVEMKDENGGQLLPNAGPEQVAISMVLKL